MCIRDSYGTTGQVLTSQGSGSAVQWADAGGGQWKKLTSGTATSGQEMEVTTSLLDSSYVAYNLELYLVHLKQHISSQSHLDQLNLQFE